MTLEPYHDFFVACAGVAGALIGLLFVAISLAPEKVTGPNADPRMQVRATAAFSALLNPLALALFSLIPDTAMITALFVVSVSGLVSCVKAFIVLFRNYSAMQFNDLYLQVSLVVVYGFQLFGAFHLRANPDDPGPLKLQAILMVVLLLIGISRAWELAGTKNLHLRVTRTPAPEAASEPAAPSEPAPPPAPDAD